MATPSPQQVGREFVRQYYTVLHEAPDVLHRFYSSGSTFVHGGVDRPGLTEEPVTGQLEIDKKIKQLNFKDCHTKIRQVDSQSTIGNGVVVQVTGELSNNGEPMRRFMQTFVLAPQTPKKFYVHNDIFRYQDEVYQDNSDTESEDPQQTETLNTNKNSTEPSLNYYQPTETNEATLTQPATNPLTSSLSTSVTSSSSSTSSSATVSTSPTSQQVILQQEPISQPVELVEPETEPQPQPQLVNGHVSQAPESVSQPDEVASQPAAQTQETTEIVKEKVTETNAKTTSAGKEELKQEQAQTTEAKSSTGHSWAKIISTGQSTSSSSNLDQQVFTGANPQVYQGQTNTGTTNSNAVNSQQKRVNGNSSNFNNSSSKGQQNKPRGQQQQQQQQQPAQQQNQQQQQQQQQQPPVQQQIQQQTQSSQQKQPAEQQRVDQMLDDEKRFGRYPDGQQVFVGNLSQDLSETELRNFFSTYGKVIDVRINTNSKQQSGRRLPNYGFVVFEDKQSVENLLNSSKSNSLTYKNEKGIEHRLNVEEKRARQGRMSSGFGGGSGGKGNRATRSSSNGSRNGPNGHPGKKNANTNNYSQSNDNNGPSNGGSGFIERRKTDVHDMNENGSHRKSNVRRS